MIDNKQTFKKSLILHMGTNSLTQPNPTDGWARPMHISALKGKG